MKASLPELARFVSQAVAGADRVIVLGMGGSSLAPLVFGQSYGRRAGYPELQVLDSTEPSSVLAVAEAGDLGRALFVVSSKSGSTLEPNILFDYFYGRVEKALGARAGERFIVVTDPGSALEKEASRRVRAHLSDKIRRAATPRSPTSVSFPPPSPAPTSRSCCGGPRAWPSSAARRGPKTPASPSARRSDPRRSRAGTR
jgi:hypothetical protein